MEKAQIQFTRQEVEQHNKLQLQTVATRPELIPKAVDYPKHQRRMHGLPSDSQLESSREST